jgi:hypothetical protein
MGTVPATPAVIVRTDAVIAARRFVTRFIFPPPIGGVPPLSPHLRSRITP